MTKESTPPAAANWPKIVTRVVELSRDLSEKEARERDNDVAKAATTQARDADEAPAAPLGWGTLLLGWYVPRASRDKPGKVVLHGYNIACYARATAAALVAAGHPIGSADRDALCAALAYAVLRHEQFHAFTDLQRWQAIAPYDRELEETLATAWEWRHAKLAIAGEVGGAAFPSAIGDAALAEWFHKITAPAYRDWRDYSVAGDFRFEMGRYTRLGTPACGTSALIDLMRSATTASNYGIVVRATAATSGDPFQEESFGQQTDAWNDTLAQRAIYIALELPVAAKYELTQEARDDHAVSLRRIRALRAFGNVKAGDLGGWIQSEDNLSHDGDCWVADEARVHGHARVFHNARVEGNAEVWDNAGVCGNARVHCETKVSGIARVSGDAELLGSSAAGGCARVGPTAPALQGVDIGWIDGAGNLSTETICSLRRVLTAATEGLAPTKLEFTSVLSPRYRRAESDGDERRLAIDLVQKHDGSCFVEITVIRRKEKQDDFRESVGAFRDRDDCFVTVFRRVYDDHAVIRVRPSQ